MTDEQPAGAGGMTSPPGSPGPAARPGYWFPPLLSGVLAAASVPLAVLLSPQRPTGYAPLTRLAYPTLTQAMYLGGGWASPPFPFPMGWYWVGALAASVLLTAAWYRWQDRRARGRIPLRGYLVTGLALAAVTAALPLAGLGVPTDVLGPIVPAWRWLDVLWQLGTFAMLAVAAGLGMLARAMRNRTLAVITAVYALAVGLAGWAGLQAIFLPSFYPAGPPIALLPAAVLLAAGLGALLATRARALRSGRRRAAG